MEPVRKGFFRWKWERFLGYFLINGLKFGSLQAVLVIELITFTVATTFAVFHIQIDWLITYVKIMY